MTTAVSSTIDSLLVNFPENFEIKGSLQNIKQEVNANLDDLSSSQSQDLCLLLRLLEIGKTDKALVWTEINALNKKHRTMLDSVKASQEEYKDSLKKIEDFQKKYTKSQKRYEESQKIDKESEQELHGPQLKLGIWHMYFVVSEKLLRKSASLANMSLEDLYSLSIINIGEIWRSPALMAAWKTMQEQYKFTETPKELWESLEDCWLEYDAFVDAKSFPKYTDAELQAAVEKEFSGEDSKFVAKFKWLCDLNKCLSDELKIQWYEHGNELSPKRA